MRIKTLESGSVVFILTLMVVMWTNFLPFTAINNNKVVMEISVRVYGCVCCYVKYVGGRLRVRMKVCQEFFMYV